MRISDWSSDVCSSDLWCWAMLANIGLPPLSVPVHSCGTSCADDCTQLLEPATFRPSVQGSRLCGPQYGVDTLLAGFSPTMAGEVPAGAGLMALVGISSEPAPRCPEQKSGGEGK